MRYLSVRPTYRYTADLTSIAVYGFADATIDLLTDAQGARGSTGYGAGRFGFSGESAGWIDTAARGQYMFHFGECGTGDVYPIGTGSGRMYVGGTGEGEAQVVGSGSANILTGTGILAVGAFGGTEVVTILSGTGVAYYGYPSNYVVGTAAVVIPVYGVSGAVYSAGSGAGRVAIQGASTGVIGNTGSGYGKVRLTGTTAGTTGMVGSSTGAVRIVGTGSAARGSALVGSASVNISAQGVGVTYITVTTGTPQTGLLTINGSGFGTITHTGVVGDPEVVFIQRKQPSAVVLQ